MKHREAWVGLSSHHAPLLSERSTRSDRMLTPTTGFDDEVENGIKAMQIASSLFEAKKDPLNPRNCQGES